MRIATGHVALQLHRGEQCSQKSTGGFKLELHSARNFSRQCILLELHSAKEDSQQCVQRCSRGVLVHCAWLQVKMHVQLYGAM